MFKKLIVFLVIFSFISCTSNEIKQEDKIQNDTNVSTEIEKAIINASESIILRLPLNATVAFFNGSEEEVDLVNHIIEEISSFLTNNSSLVIVERERFEIIEREQNWQMDTGYVTDDEMISIVGRFGAQYVVSSYISGNGHLQRLRIKTWNASNGQTIVTSAYPTNILGEQFIQVSGRNPLDASESISSNGITIDYHWELPNFTLQSSIYIDGTMFYFIVDFNKRWDGTYYFDIYNFRSDGVVITRGGEELYGDNYYVLSFLETAFLNFFSSQGLDRRNINNISDILKNKIYNDIMNVIVE